MRFFAFLILLLSVSGCVNRSPRMLVLSYADFEPQVAAHPIIGFAWYQWEHHGGSHPWDHDDVQVVVYDGLSLTQVRQKYPVVQSRHQDYRYLSLRQAMKYIDDHAQEVPSLLRTRQRLVSHFGYTK